MLCRWAVALTLLIPAVAGCRSAPPVRPAATIDLLENASNSTAETRTQPTTEEGVTLSGFEEPEPSPMPPGESSLKQETLTPAALERIAFENNPTLASAAARMDVARGRQVQAGLYPNPVIGYHATEIGNQGTAGQQGGFIAQRFITAGKLGLDQAIAGKEIDEAHFRFHAQEQRVLSDVRVGFYNALVAQRRLELTEELAQIGDDLVEATDKLLKARVGTENNLLQAEIKADEARILFDNSRNEQIEAWRRLAAVTGVPNMPVQNLDGPLDADLPEFEWEACYKLALENNPELQAAQARVERASIAIRRARKEPIPDVDLWVSVRHHNVTESEVASVQLGIPVPIFDRNQGNIRSAEAEWVAANNEVKRIELELQDRLAVAYRRYANARRQVERYGRRMLPRAKKSLELVTNAYDTGQAEYLTLLIAQQTYLEVSLSYLASMQELRTSAAVIEGQLLSGSLTAKQ